MTSPPEAALLGAAAIVAGGFAALAIFRRLRIPDVPLLLGLGVGLAGVGLVDAGFLRGALPALGTAAIVLVLFEGGLHLRPRDLRAAAGRGTLLAFVVFGATAALCAAVGYAVAGLPPHLALLLGACLGGAGVLIVIPLIGGMNAGPEARTVVTVEAVVSDVLVVLAVVAMATIIAAGGGSPEAIGALVASTLSVALVAGGLGGVAWAAFLRQFRPERHVYALTAAALFVAYVGTEALGGSGLLAVLAFGVAVGNSRVEGVITSVALGVQDEAVFLLRATFFVALGASLDLALLASPTTLLVGTGLAVAVIAARMGAGALILRSMTPWDRLATSLMFPLGLAAAALALVPYERFGIAGTENFGAYAAVAVVATNVLAGAAVAVALHVRGRSPSPAPTTTAVALAAPWRRV